MIDELLSRVQKPARYTGGEVNQIVKDAQTVAVRFAFCFPDTYEVGMSHLGMKLLYHILNRREDTLCERVFAPWVDMEREMRMAKLPLFSIETHFPVRDFDIVGFTLQYELSYSNVLNMMELANIPILADQRGEDMPLIVGGGPCVFNPEPLCDFFDLFVLGDGEKATGQLCALIAEGKRLHIGKEALLLRAAQEIPGVYVPRFYTARYMPDGSYLGTHAIIDDIPKKVYKAIVSELSAAEFPDNIIVPNTAIVHDRIVLEIARGCTRGCRFCQAGMIYRPQRERGLCELLELANALVASTGYEEISLASLSTGDYSHLTELATKLVERHGGDRVSLSLPSLRVDTIVREALIQTEGLRKSGLTFAPEAGTQRLRDVINKGVTAEQLAEQVRDAFIAGWNSLKLYFMIGLPTETDEDLSGIVKLVKQVASIYYSLPGESRSQKGLRISVSTSAFVPKSHTPFQWCGQDERDELRRKQQMLRRALRIRGVDYTYHDANISFLEAAFARGDRRLGRVLLRAHELGCKFDGWNEHFHFDAWLQAFADCGLDAARFASSAWGLDIPLPWDHLSCGVSKEFLINEYHCALRAEITPDCKSGCKMCGMAKVMGGVCPCA